MALLTTLTTGLLSPEHTALEYTFSPVNLTGLTFIEFS